LQRIDLDSLAHERTAAFDSADEMLEEKILAYGVETPWEDAVRAEMVPLNGKVDLTLLLLTYL
jgi:hypothetical protein